MSVLHACAGAGPSDAIALLAKQGVLDALADRMGLCCMGVANGGVEHCTCWEPIHDLEQATELDAAAPLETRSKCCHDCAYRNDSPERSGDDAEWLLDLPGGATTFFCHEGVRRVLRYRHPSGIVLPTGPGDYNPPRGDGRIYQADGSPGLICAGFAAHRYALLWETHA